MSPGVDVVETFGPFLIPAVLLAAGLPGYGVPSALGRLTRTGDDTDWPTVGEDGSADADHGEE